MLVRSYYSLNSFSKDEDKMKFKYYWVIWVCTFLGENRLKHFDSCYALFIIKLKKNVKLREDTHKKSVFFSRRTTKGVGRLNLPGH